MRSQTRAIVIFFLGFAALLLALHVPYLKLPFFWDELGQFIPASLDLFRSGAWIPKTTLPNVHPPAVMAYLALSWKIFGFSILSTRVAMLLIGSAGALFSFLLAIRLSRHLAGAPAFAAVLFLLATPMFYMQSMMAQLDMPGDDVDRAGAVAIPRRSLRVVRRGMHGTGAREGNRNLDTVRFRRLVMDSRRTPAESLYFLAPAVALAGWLLYLHHGTGHWLGNDQFARYNVGEALRIAHIFGTLQRRLYFLLISDGLWIGAITLVVGARVFKGRDWNVAFVVAGAQILLVSVFGGASLDRYSMPVYPILYAAMAAAGSVYPSSWRWATQGAMIFALSMGLYWNPPYPFSFENNLAMVDFVELHKEAANYLEMWAPGKRIASVWPFTDEVQRPEFGYVQHKLKVQQAEDFRLTSLANLDRKNIDVLVVFSRNWALDGGALDYEWMRAYLRRNWGYYTQATSDQIRAGLGFRPIVKLTRRGQWIEIYLPE